MTKEKEHTLRYEEQEQHSSQEHLIRVEKAKKLRELGVEPWPEYKKVTTTSKDVVEHFKEGVEKEYTIAGRLVALRGHGKTIFGKLQDREGAVQVYFKKDVLGEATFDLLEKYIDVGDLLWVRGFSFKTKTDEITLRVEEVSLLGKCLHPLPEKFHGLADIETRYRQRYLDLIADQVSRNRFIARSKIISTIRHFLEDHGFMEVETPMLHPIPGGAAARPFVTHHNALNSDFFLRIAPELYLKRLVVGGFERVYEINRNFRNEGISTRHNPEFTMLEFYLAHHDYHYIMDFVEQLLKKIAIQVQGTTHLMFHGHSLDFSQPFSRLSVKDAVLLHGKLQEADIAPHAIDTQLKKHGITLKVKDTSYAQKLFLLFEEVAEKQLIQPTFIIDYPVEISPLAKSDANKPGFVARFELFIGGMEFANAFNELNDPFDQEQRFREQAAHHQAGDDEAHRYDAEYVQALQYGLFPTVGCGIGIDRLVMLMTDAPSIKDVILFPTLKRHQ
jgi:lysyl-tRNA synthetase class 2